MRLLTSATRVKVLSGIKSNEYLYVTYPAPPPLTRGKTSVTVRFTPKVGNAGGLFDLRVLSLPR